MRTALLPLLLFFSSPLLAQERPLEKGEFEASWGASLLRAEELFGPQGERQSLEDALGLVGGEYREFFLWARLSYAWSERLTLSLDGPLVRGARLSGEVFDRGESLGLRREETIGPGDLRLGLSFFMAREGALRWGFSADTRLPLGDSSARLPRGVGLPGLGGGVWLWHDAGPSFLRASLRLGSGNGLELAAEPELSLGFRRGRFALSGALFGRITPEALAPADPRAALSGVAPGRGYLKLGPELLVSLGETRLYLSARAPLLGRQEAAGTELSAGVLLGPAGRRAN